MTTQDELTQLIGTLVNGDSLEEQIAVGHRIQNYGDEAVEPLIALLKNPDHAHLWWLIVDALGRIGDQRAVEPIIAMLESPLSHDPWKAMLSRRYAAWALAKLKDPRAIDALLEMFNDRLYDEEDDGEVVDEPDIENIEAAVWALTEIGDLKTLPQIIEVIFDKCCIYNVFNEWGEPAFQLLLQELRNSDDHRRSNAAHHLGEYGDHRAIEPLIHLLKNDKSNDVRDSAAYGLGCLRDPLAFDVLTEALNDPYEQVRMHAAFGLLGLKDRRAIEPLKRAIEKESSYILEHLKRSLQSLEESTAE